MNKRRLTVILCTFFITLISTLLSLCLGAARISLSELYNALFNGPVSSQGYILWYVRMPRTAACLLSGMALSVSGAVIQAVLNNKLASPGIIGVNSGAGLAVTVCCAFGLLSGWIVSAAAFGGAMLTVFLIVFTAQKTGASRTTVILGGVAINSLLNALCEALTTLFPEIAMLSSDFRIGDFSSVTASCLIPAGILIAAALALLFTLSNDLDVLSLGEDTARGLGMPVRRMRTLFLVLAAMLAGASVSFAGLLGFVGLLVPHAARKLIGSDSRYLLPLCAIGGAGFVTLCDLAARTLFAPYELAVGILMAVIGGPFFLLLLLKRKGGHADA